MGRPHHTLISHPFQPTVIKEYTPREIQQPKPVDVLLILRRHRDTVDCALDISSSQERQCVAGVDSKGSVLRLGPLPLVSFVVTDLECCNGLSAIQLIEYVDAKRY